MEVQDQVGVEQTSSSTGATGSPRQLVLGLSGPAAEPTLPGLFDEPPADPGIYRRQLVLRLFATDHGNLTTWQDEGSQPVMPILHRFLSDASVVSLYLSGPAGSGRTHLLTGLVEDQPTGQSICVSFGATQFPVHPDMLTGLDAYRVIALDDVDLVAGRHDWEVALFHLFNDCVQSGCKLVLSASKPLRATAWVLPDLRSRLSMGLQHTLEPLSEDACRVLIQQRARDRGIALPAEVVQYLFSRSQRDMSSLMAILDRLDSLAMEQGRMITIPFVKSCMGW